MLQPLPSDGARPPLVAELELYEAREATSFHMPGHKGGPGAHPLAHELIGAAALRSDVSEIGGFDYLHSPEGNLLEAQRLAARTFGADQTFFLVNGSTIGNIAAISATVGDGDKLMMFRGSHRSVFSATVLAGATPIYIEPTYDPELDGYFGVDFHSVAAALEQHPDIKAIHITRPSYYGICCDLRPFVDIARQFGLPLIVDEAHGAHFAFHPGLPTSATVAGADLVIHSTHKTLGSLTQSSLLHFRERVVDIRRLTQYLNMLQSSSPSALLLLSLDLACAHMAGEGRGLLDQAVRLAFHAREQINMIEGLWCYGDEMIGRSGVDSYDSTKLVIDLRGISIGGFAAASWLRDRHRIGVELADLHRIVCSVTIGDTEGSVADLIAALRSLAEHAQTHEKMHVPPQRVQLPGIPEMALSPRQASLAAWTVRPLEQARGGISAEFIIPYPPGIPMIVPGEIISAELISTIAELKRHGHKIVGPSDSSLRTVRLLKTDP